jgi:ribosomal protein S14
MAVYCEFCGAPTDYLTTTQVAKLFGVSRLTVRKWIKRGRFPGTELIQELNTQGVYKIPASAVLPLLEGH